MVTKCLPYIYTTVQMLRLSLFFVFIICSPVYSQRAEQSTLHADARKSKAVVTENTLPASKEATYSITITVKNIRNKDGVIRFKFYNDTTQFPHDFGFLKVVVPKTEMTGDSLHLTLHGFPSQRMAIALLDDENNNVKLDFGWFLPKEGHAFSDYYHSALRRPVYNDFAFTLTGDKSVVMTMRYY